MFPRRSLLLTLYTCTLYTCTLYTRTLYTCTLYTCTMYAQGGLEPLLSLLRHGQEDVQKHAAGAIANLATDAECQISLIRHTNLDTLLLSVRSAHAEVRQEELFVTQHHILDPLYTLYTPL
jgi:hypothetical protein